VAKPTEAGVMPWMEPLSDPQDLRRCIRDLVALSTLPAIWNTDDSDQISDSIAGAGAVDAIRTALQNQQLGRSTGQMGERRLRRKPNPGGGRIFRFTLAATSRTGEADAP
jgi:hypothetical protein